MAKYLVIFKDLVDDVDVNGFTVMTEKEVNEYEELAQSITWPFSFPIGDTKISFSDGEDLLSKLEYKEITNEEAKGFNKIFEGEFGTFVGETFLNEIAVDESEEDFENELDEEEGIPLYDNDDYDDDY